MHDIDRTAREFETEFGETGGQEVELQENESFLGNILGGVLGGETEMQEQGFLGESQETEASQGFLGESQGFLGESQETYEAPQGFLGEVSHEAVFDEVQEMELAAELLEVSNEAELEQFLGKLVRGAAKAVGKIARGPVGQALGGVLKKVAKTALPMAGAALGNLVLPGVGGAIGGKLASAAGNMFGLELEGLSPQDREFEVARRFVRFAGATTQRAVRMPPTVPPTRAIRTAITSAARRHAPGLLQPRIAARRGGPRMGVSSPVFQPGALNGRRRPGRPVYAPSYGVGYGASYDTPSYTDGDGTDEGSAGTQPFLRSGRWFRRGRKIILVGV